MRPEFTESVGLGVFFEEFGNGQLEGKGNIRSHGRIRTLEYSQGSGMSLVSKQLYQGGGLGGEY